MLKQDYDNILQRINDKSSRCMYGNEKYYSEARRIVVDHYRAHKDTPMNENDVKALEHKMLGEKYDGDPSRNAVFSIVANIVVEVCSPGRDDLEKKPAPVKTGPLKPTSGGRGSVEISASHKKSKDDLER